MALARRWQLLDFKICLREAFFQEERVFDKVNYSILRLMLYLAPSLARRCGFHIFELMHADIQEERVFNKVNDF